MSGETLFTGRPDEPERIAPAEMSPSPLGRYVTTEMPGDLAAIRAVQEWTESVDFLGFAYQKASKEAKTPDLGALREEYVRIAYGGMRTKQEAALNGVVHQIGSNTDSHIATITQLDLAFMLGGYLPLEGDAYRAAPPQLLGLLDQQADRFGLPPRMDYELVIDVNCKEYLRNGHMRTFLAGEAALEERDFYFGHYESEPYVKAVAYQLHSAIDHPERVDITGILEAALGNMHKFREYMAAYLRLRKEGVFDVMRPYLASYPDGIRNASGAFMPSVQLAELALHAPSEGQNTYIDESMRYFPRWAREVMTGWQEQSMRGNNIEDLVSSGKLSLDDEGKPFLTQLIGEFLRFRTTHMAATRRQIPEAFVDRDVPVSRRQLARFGEPDIMADGKKGTAGFDIVNVLGGAAHRLVIAGENVEQMQGRIQ
jgi:hypothetical protein